ncbi:MAG: hypothetical protein ACE5I1_26880 [bacterium]
MAKQNPTIEQRIAILEKELFALKSHLENNSQKPWWLKIAGAFENDPVFDEIVELGQKFREQERAKAKS